MAVVLRRYWPFFLTLVVVSGVLSFATVRYGSLAAARAYLRGDQIVAEPAVVDLGVISANSPAYASR